MDPIDQPTQGPSRVRPENQPYRKLAELSPTPQCVCVDGKVVFANAAFLALSRAAKDESVIGRGPEEFVAQSRREAFRNRIVGAVRTGVASPCEMEQWVALDGETLEVESSVTPVPWENGIAALLVLRDLTSASAWDRECRRVESQLRTVTERITRFALFTTDSAGRISSWNPGAERVFGYSEGEIVGQDIAIIFTPEDRMAGAHLAEATEAANTGLAQDERWHLRKGGDRCFLNGWLVAVRDEAGKLTGFTKIAQDYTERKLAEEALRVSEQRYRDLVAELERRVMDRTRHLEQTVQTWESFCYSMAHDLRAPLRTISGFAHALLEDYANKLDTTAQDYARRMVAAAQRLDEFIQDLLDFGRLAHAPLPLREVNLGEIVEQVLAELNLVITSSGAKVRVDRPLPVVWANRAALEQVVTNLLTNAFKFVAPGKVPRVTIRSVHNEGRARLWIEDCGIGIDPEYQERVFQLFERLHPQSTYPGTGVGLAIVRKAMERMGGDVGLSSVPGEGTAVWIDLPERPVPEPPLG